MAKVRRVIRKTDAAGEGGFDDQFWPVIVALVILGGFLLSVIFVYLDNQPWMFWPSLILLPIVITAAIVLLSKISSKFWRRSMQLALVISVIAHLIALIWTVESIIFAKMLKPQDELTDLVRDREPIVAPDYTQQEQREIQTELEEIVDTPDPVPEPEELEPEPEEIEEPEPEPEPPQPTPVPEPEETERPQTVERQETTETVARQSETTSSLSRQTTQASAQTGTVADVPETSQEQASAQAEPNQTEVERQTTEQQVQRSESTDVPSSTMESRTTELARTQPQESATTETTNAPTLPREVNTATLNTPTTNVDTPDTPTTPREVEQAVQPQNVAEARQTTSETLERPEVEVNTPTPTQTANTERRERAEERPTDASTPTLVENTRPRETPRPTVNAVADVPTPTTAPTESPRQPTPDTVQTNPNQAAQSTPTITQTQTNAEPTSNPSPTQTNTPQRNASSQAVAQSTPTSIPSPSRSEQTSPSAATPTTAVSAAVAPNNAPSQATATNVPTANTAVAQQNTSSPSATRPSPNASPSTPTNVAASSATQSTRRPSSETASTTVAQSNTSVSRTRTDNSATPSASTSAATDVASSQAPTQSNSPNPSASDSSVARQETSNTATATQSQFSQPTQTASPSTQVAGANRARTQTSNAPSISSDTAATDSPRRSSENSVTAASPTAVESPAESVATRGAGNPALSPAATSVTQSESGTAGIGSSPNVDRGQPAADSPANTASNSATRAQATQNTPTGEAFEPSQIAQMSRSRADMPTPSATVEASDLPNATRPGADAPSDTNATASAAQVNSQSDADDGPVTAAAGSTDTDLGPTKVVSENAAGRASGGGEEALNFDTQANQPSRSETGGSPTLALNSPSEAEDPSAPAGTGGGQPNVELNADAVAVAPSETGGETPVTGGPSTMVEEGPAADVSTGETEADRTLARAEAAEAAPGEATAGGGDEDDDEEDEEEQLARENAAGSPQIAMSAPTVGETPVSPEGQPGGDGPSSPTAVTADATDVARTETGAGTPAASGGPSAAVEAGEVSDTGGGAQIAQAQAGRAEAVEAAPGDVAIGGGSSSPSRSVAGAQIAASTQAETVSEAGRTASSGSPTAPAANAQGVEIARLAGGAAGPTVTGPTGALGGPTAVIAAATSVQGTAAGLRAASARIANSGDVAMNNSNQGPQRSSTDNLPSGTPTNATVNDIQTGTTASTGDAQGDLGGTDVGDVSRQQSGGLVVNIQANEGAGGLGDQYASNAGLDTRRASSESTAVQIASNSRFVRSDPGGRISVNNDAIITAEAFENRRPPGSGDGGSNRASPETERAIEMGLGFLHKNQLPDGSWSLNNFGQRWIGQDKERAELNSDAAATGLSVLAFQGAGYTHKEWKYAQSVKRGIDWLVAHQKDNGDLYVEKDEFSSKNVRLYSHSIAALALCEAYGMTGDPQLKEPAQKAIDFIVEAQDKRRGGWRYRPGINADTSVSGWMVMAMYSADLAGLDVSKDTYDGVKKYLEKAKDGRSGAYYRYNPDARASDPRQADGLKASPSMTSVGLLMRLYTGWHADDPRVIKGSDYLLNNLPTEGTATDVLSKNHKRDSYYWYYATMVMINAGGDRWKTWQDRLHPLLVNTQAQQGVKAGSWDPGGRIPDKWGRFGGRLYVTTLNLLSLEVQYRKLPLYHEVKLDENAQ